MSTVLDMWTDESTLMAGIGTPLAAWRDWRDYPPSTKPNIPKDRVVTSTDNLWIDGH